MKKYITILIVAVIVSALAVAVWAETNMPFEDVPENAYYTEAVLWAYENGITKGTTGTTFSPDGAVTRGQLVTILYRYWQAFDKPVPAPVATSADAPMPSEPTAPEEPTVPTMPVSGESSAVWRIEGKTPYPSALYSVSVIALSDDQVMLSAKEIGRQFAAGDTIRISASLNNSAISGLDQRNEINRLLNKQHVVVSADGDELIISARVLTFDERTISLAAVGDTPDYVQIERIN